MIRIECSENTEFTDSRLIKYKHTERQENLNFTQPEVIKQVKKKVELHTESFHVASYFD